MVGEKHGPVVDAIVGHEAANAEPGVGVRLSQGQGGGQTGAEVRGVDVNVALGVPERRQVLEQPGKGIGRVVNRRRPTERNRAIVATPSVVDAGNGQVLEELGDSGGGPVGELVGGWKRGKMDQKRTLGRVPGAVEEAIANVSAMPAASCLARPRPAWHGRREDGTEKG